MISSPHKIAVIGAGPMGLACAYDLLKKGHSVEIYEADDRIGGMSASFDFEGLRIERYYHFICGPDQPLFDLLEELQLSEALRWRETKLGFFYHGKLYPWGNPWALLRFPKLNLIQKFRYAAHILHAKSITDWREYDQIHATDWLKSWLGEKTYQMLWESLFHLKFFEHKNDLSAAWLGTRIKRVALSRKNLFTEQLGYLEGGSETLLTALRAKIEALGGKIHLATPVRQIVTHENRVTAIRIEGDQRPVDQVISTIPLPYVPRIAPDLPAEFQTRILEIQNIGVVCVLFKLTQPLTENFWLNIQDPEIQVPGVIEYSNLNPLANAVVYVPFYMSQSHSDYRKPETDFVQRSLRYLQKINPAFSPDWVLSQKVSRYEFAQTICPPGFYEMLPPMKTPLTGLFMADTSYYYPEDRSISESVRVGYQLARQAHDDAMD